MENLLANTTVVSDEDAENKSEIGSIVVLTGILAVALAFCYLICFLKSKNELLNFENAPGRFFNNREIESIIASPEPFDFEGECTNILNDWEQVKKEIENLGSKDLTFELAEKIDGTVERLHNSLSIFLLKENKIKIPEDKIKELMKSSANVISQYLSIVRRFESEFSSSRDDLKLKWLGILHIYNNLINSPNLDKTIQALNGHEVKWSLLECVKYHYNGLFSGFN